MRQTNSIRLSSFAAWALLLMIVGVALFTALGGYRTIGSHEAAGGARPREVESLASHSIPDSHLALPSQITFHPIPKAKNEI